LLTGRNVSLDHPRLNAKHPKPFEREKPIAHGVAVFGVRSTVDLDDELVRETSKVGDVKPDRMLPSPARTRNRATTKMLPENRLGRRGMLAMIASTQHEGGRKSGNRTRVGLAAGHAAPCGRIMTTVNASAG